MDSITNSVIELFCSKKEDNDEPNYAEEDDGTDSPVMDESGIANISCDSSDEEGDQSPGEQGGEHVAVVVTDDHGVMYNRLQRSRPLSTPAAASGPVLERQDRMLTEWLWPR